MTAPHIYAKELEQSKLASKLNKLTPEKIKEAYLSRMAQHLKKYLNVPNEKLAALRASALRADLSRVEQMIEDMPFTKNKQVVNVAEQLRKDLAEIAATGR